MRVTPPGLRPVALLSSLSLSLALLAAGPAGATEDLTTPLPQPRARHYYQQGRDRQGHYVPPHYGPPPKAERGPAGGHPPPAAPPPMAQ